MATVPDHTQWLQRNIYDIPSNLGNFWNELTPDQEYSQMMKSRSDNRARNIAQQNAIAKEMTANQNDRSAMYSEQELAPQGVIRPTSQSYGSENMHNYQRVPTAAPALGAQGMVKPLTPDQEIDQARAFARSGSAPGISATQAQRDGINMRENSGSRTKFDDRMKTFTSNRVDGLGNRLPMNAEEKAYVQNSGKLVPTSLGSSIPYRERTAPTAAAKASPHGYNEWTGQAMSNWKDKYRMPDTRDIVSGNYTSSPKQDMRIPEQQTKALGTNVADPLGRQGDSDFNQTADTQALNNGNINNPKATNNPNANRGNGFWN